jgi:dipeptidyl aminopeptidase/acylaminoacyl peptidase
VIATVNAPLAETDPPEVRPVRHRGADGQALTSWLFLPTASSGDPRPPLIVRPYLGASFPTPPRDPTAELGFPQNLRMLTGHGYAVLVPSLPSPPGGLTEPADRLADRILKIVDVAAADPALGPRFDADRLALIGFSFGGYTVMTTLTQTHRFRAAVAMDGISDLTALWSALSPFSEAEPEGGYTTNWHTGGVEATQPRLLAPPWVEPDRYVRNSPIYAADKIETPLLLVHGAIDQIPLAQSEAMYSALFRQEKDAILVTYWGALHGLTSPGDVRDLYARTFEFLDQHLARPVRSGATAP